MATYADMTNLADVMKNVYSNEEMQKQFNEEMISFNTLPRAEGAEYELRGNGFIFGARVGRNDSGARKAGEQLPAPLVGKYDQSKITARYLYGRMNIDGPTIEAGKGDFAAFARTMDDQMNDVLESVKWGCERQFWGDGFGLLGTTAAVATPSTSAAWAVTLTSTKGCTYFRPGMLVDFFQSTTMDDTASSHRVSSIDWANNKVYFEKTGTTYRGYHPSATAAAYTQSTATIASGSLIVTVGSRETTHATTNVARELTGLEGIYDDGTLLASFQDITVSGNEWWKANILDNGAVGRELTEDLMIQGYNAGRIVGGQKPKLIRMGLGQQRKYVALYTPDVRFAPQEIKGGFKTMTFAAGDGDTQILIDPLCTPGKIYFEPENGVKKFVMRELGWLDLDQVMHMVRGYDLWELAVGMYANMGTMQRNALTKITDLLEPTRF